MSEAQKIVVVGGGTAGWMSAAVLSRALGHLARVELIESEQIGTVGVGEATIPQILLLLNLLGIDEHDFLRRTQGSIKLGIQFVDWARIGDAYIHDFGRPGRPLGMLGFHHYWLRARASGIGADLPEYSLNAVAAANNRYDDVASVGNTGICGLEHAFHFDASLVAKYLRRLSEATGVVRTEGKIVDVALDSESGFVESVQLESGDTVAGDLFIDCSGFRGLLIEQALETGYEDWTHWLPCDRAMAVPCESVEPLTPYTRSTARTAGWQWRIPLQHRIGNGHVYSSAYMSDDDAARILMENLDGRPLADPRPLRFTTGRRKKLWNRNVVALGLASGFLEPLESTSIHLVQSGLSRLINLFPDRGFTQATVDEYNRQYAYEFERIRDFIILHYHANERTDSEFWVERREMAIPDTLADRLALFRQAGRFVEDAGDLFKESSWIQVMLGQRIEPSSYHPMADLLTDEQLAEFLGGIRRLIDERSAALRDHRAYLEKHCPAIEGT